MTALDGVLTAWSFRDGVAARRSSVRHRRLQDEPIALVAWHLGGEPFSVAALAYGTSPDDFELAVPGQALNRDRLFAALLPVAHWFNQRFEEPWARRTEVPIGKKNPRWVERAPDAPQVVVPNAGAVKALGRLGRRLAYLPTEVTPDGPPPADPALVRFGRHLLWLTGEARRPGQQLLIDTCGLVASNWVTPQTPGERANLASLDAWVEPPPDTDGFAAAARAEDIGCGPIPDTSREEREVAPIVDAISQAMNAGDAAREAVLVAQLMDRYRDLTEPAWRTMWRCLRREGAWPEDRRFVLERVERDVVAYSDHMGWMNGPVGGRRRIRATHQQAFRALREAEVAASLVEAQETIADPLRMIPLLCTQQAVEGVVVAVDRDHKEVKPGNVRATAAPIVTLHSTIPCVMAPGKQLWWTEAAGVGVEVGAIAPAATGGSVVELRVTKGAAMVKRDLVEGTTACFSKLSTSPYERFGTWPELPFTHVPAPGDEPSLPGHLEAEGA